MRKLSSVLLIAVFGFVLALPAAAQDMMEDKIVCDSTLITLLFIAEYEYGYEPMMDVSAFEKGQFAPLFDAMMSMMDDMAESDMMDDMAGDEMTEDMAGDEMTEDEMMGEAMMDDMMTLAPGVVAGEPAECTDLRASLEAFIYDHFSMALMDNSM